jgi:hypothetical protein
MSSLPQPVKFIPGLELSRRCYLEGINPILQNAFLREQPAFDAGTEIEAAEVGPPLPDQMTALASFPQFRDAGRAAMRSSLPGRIAAHYQPPWARLQSTHYMLNKSTSVMPSETGNTPMKASELPRSKSISSPSLPT